MRYSLQRRKRHCFWRRNIRRRCWSPPFCTWPLTYLQHRSIKMRKSSWSSLRFLSSTFWQSSTATPRRYKSMMSENFLSSNWCLNLYRLYLAISLYYFISNKWFRWKELVKNRSFINFCLLHVKMISQDIWSLTFTSLVLHLIFEAKVPTKSIGVPWPIILFFLHLKKTFGFEI